MLFSSTSYFKNFVDDLNSKNGRLKDFPVYINYDLGVYKDISLGDALSFPVKTDNKLYVSGSDSTKRFSVESTSFILAYKSQGKIYVDFIQPVPTSNDSTFKGYILHSKWNTDKPKRILYYVKGEYIG